MNILKKHLVLTFLSLSFCGFSQDYDNSTTKKSITIDGDPRIEKLINTYDKIKKKNNKVSVYRVQVFSGTRNNANSALSHFKKKYFSLYSNIMYDQPNFKVKVGAFRSRNEANQFVKSIKKSYNSSFVLKERIDYSEFTKVRKEIVEEINNEDDQENTDY